MLVSNDKNNLYSKVTNKSYSTARDYMSSTYGQPRVHYYNADTPDEKAKKKRGKAKYIALIITTASVALGIALTLLSKNNKIDFSGVQEAGEKVKDMHIEKQSANVMSNFTNVKDDYWEKFADKLKEFKIFNKHPLSFISTIGEKMRGFYLKLVHNALSGEYEKQQLKVLELANNEGVSVDVPNFTKWYYSLSDEIFDRLHQKGNRVTDNLINKGFWQKFTSSNIADTKLEGVAKKAVEKIAVPENASEELIAEISKLNEIKTKTAGLLIPKLRDINAGSAATDLLTQIISLTSLGVVVATSDTKEEKRSVIIDLGIPLMTALGTTTIATVKALSGATALAFGIILGQVASITARTISNAYIKHAKKKEEKLQNQ